jgi:hypothetical protein
MTPIGNFSVSSILQENYSWRREADERVLRQPPRTFGGLEKVTVLTLIAEAQKRLKRVEGISKFLKFQPTLRSDGLKAAPKGHTPFYDPYVRDHEMTTLRYLKLYCTRLYIQAAVPPHKTTFLSNTEFSPASA